MTVGDAAGIGLRERKKQETRAALSWAVIELSVERGWDEVTVDDIAEAVNVSARTFRNYFSSKAEAVVARHLDRMLHIADDLRERPSDEPLGEAIVNAVKANFQPRNGRDPDEARMPIRRWVDGLRLMLTEPDVRGEFLKANAAGQAELAAAIAERTGADLAHDFSPALAAATTCAAITVAMDQWLSNETTVPFGPLLEEVLNRLRAAPLLP